MPVSSCDGVGGAGLQTLSSTSIQVRDGFHSIPYSQMRRKRYSPETSAATKYAQGARSNFPSVMHMKEYLSKELGFHLTRAGLLSLRCPPGVII